ncbi:MAG: YitT family protein [Balneolaceae bacterium]
MKNIFSKKNKADPSQSDYQHHSVIDDIQGILIGTLLASFGIAIFTHMNFLIGGTAGIAFLTQYATDFSFGPIFFIINVPFYYLAMKKMGWEFTIKTFLAVFLVSFFTETIPYVFEFGYINPWYASLFGGFLIGSGLLMLFRHKASLGGLNIVSIFLQENYKISAGKFQMAVDTIIILGAFFIVDWAAVMYSVFAAVALNIILAINHKPGRYRPMP